MLPDFPLIVADESVDARIVRSLRQHGYQVFSIVEEVPGIGDEKVIEISNNKSAYILTEDKDFGDILVYNNSSYHNYGSMLLRIFDLETALKIELVVNTLARHSSSLIGNFAVLTSKKLRIRRYNF